MAQSAITLPSPAPAPPPITLPLTAQATATMIPPSAVVRYTVAQWMTVEEFALLMGRATRTIRLWCQDGTLETFGYRKYQDGSGRWWILYEFASVVVKA
jgi:hypothetical protein